MSSRNLPRGISRVWVCPGKGRKPYEVFQVSGCPGGIRKTWKVCIAPRGERKAFAMAKAKRQEYEATSRPWGSGGRVARLRVDPASVPESMKFPGLIVCPHRAVVMASRAVKCPDGQFRTIYLCYPYQIDGGSLPTFSDAIEQCRRGQGTLNELPKTSLVKAWKANKKAVAARKRGENMSNALMSFDVWKAGTGSMQEAAAINHAFDRAS